MLTAGWGAAEAFCESSNSWKHKPHAKAYAAAGLRTSHAKPERKPTVTTVNIYISNVRMQSSANRVL